MTTSRSAMQEVAPKLAEITADTLFGDVWERPELSKRDRSLILDFSDRLKLRLAFL